MHTWKTLIATHPPPPSTSTTQTNVYIIILIDNLLFEGGQVNENNQLWQIKLIQ